MDTVAAKVAKLFKLANDGGATEAEAERAMELANALITKYGLDMAQVEAKEETVLGGWIGDEAWDKKYHSLLATAVGYLYTVRPVMDGYGRFCFAGLPSSIEAAAQTLPWLIDQVERLYKQFLPKGMSKSDRAEYRRTFKQAAAIRVANRAWAISESLRNDNLKALEATGHTALVVKNHTDKLIEDAKAVIAHHMDTRQSKGRPMSTGLGTRAGLKAGDQVKLSQEVRGEAPKLLK